MRWPIRYQILVPYAGVTVVALAGASFLNAYLAARQREQQIETQLGDIGRTLVQSSFPLTDAVLAQMRGLSGAEFVLLDARGKTVASSRRFATAIPASAAPTRRGEPLQLGQPVVLDGSRYVQAAIAVDRLGAADEPAVLRILFPEERWLQSRREAAYPPLALGGASLVVGMGLAAWIAASLSRPIQQLRLHLGQLTAGDFAPTAVPARNDEVRDLVLSANVLAGQLDQMRRAIQQSERLSLLGQLSAGLGHQLRNHVTGARMAVQIHGRKCSGVDGESLEVALRQLALTEELLKRFLASGQLGAPRRTNCDLARLVEEWLPLVAPAFRHRRVALSVKPGSALPVEACADAEQMRQLLANLTLNGLEAAGAGGWVRIEYEKAAAGQILLRVLDSGPGVPNEFAGRLFEPFATTRPEGIGLGLAVARQIAEAHGGHLRYDRRDGATCFELSLPLPAADGKDPP